MADKLSRYNHAIRELTCKATSKKCNHCNSHVTMVAARYSALKEDRIIVCYFLAFKDIKESPIKIHSTSTRKLLDAYMKELNETTF